MTLTHQLGEYMAADGLTKATTAAQAALRNFLADNLLGEKGVEMSKIQRAVEKKLESAYAAKKMSLANLSAPYLEKLAQAANAESQGLTKMGKFFVNRLFSVE
jgi:spore germination cell wall hydrolase CwlJ-like protein